MVKVRYLNYTEIEFDTETEKSRLIKAWTTLPKGKKPKKEKVQATVGVSEVVEI